MTEPTKPTGLALMRVPFPANQIGKLPKPYKKDSPKGKCGECGGWHGLPAAHLDYVGHAATTDRLLDCDPGWYWEPLATTPEGLPKFDEIGGLWIKLTVCGVTRIGYGNADKKGYADMGTREKEVIGDALRNAAMRFGAALDLWHKGDLHGEGPDDPPFDDGRPPESRERDDVPSPPPLPGRGELEPYPSEKFKANIDGWTADIQAGKYTPEAIIAKVSTRNVLNPTQLAKLKSLKAN